MPRLPRARWHRPSLTWRLVLTAAALVLTTSLVVGAVATLAVRSYLMQRLDDDLADAARQSERAPAQLYVSGSFTPPPSRGDQDDDGRRLPGGNGTLSAYYADVSGYDGDPVGNVVDYDRDNSVRSLSAKALDELETVPTGSPTTLEVPGVGHYRVQATTTVYGKVVTGLPTDGVDGVVTRLVVWEGLLVLAGTGLAGLAGLVLVRRQMRPLREVSATAHAVAALPLAEGEISLEQRVPARLTDEHTEVGQVGAALNTLLAHVEDSLSARHRSEQQVRQFVADASHELRTPLATIAGYAELARRRPDDASAQQTALGKVEEESARMTALVEDLLLLARLDSGRPLEQRPVDLVRLLVEAVSDARVLAPGHRWRLELPEAAVEDGVEVIGDEHRLHQVVTNLLTNARKYTPEGSTVTVTALRDGFVVRDDGPGFPPDLVPHAFERFSRGDVARTRGDDTRPSGAGLGLSLVQAIVAAHGGLVTLSSTPGDTRFEVRVAAAETDE
ncbi:sensor histidine kinase [Nocardioides acrostichi]|uniref:histidine kinase n=1 Tax=Nocardioides acrostichi TaxID=2784339 RepID=A0A930UXR4_9ACTN|nr:HAMP domain-containing sensor histidine kinase [Nocardioides acrostichi]MBF4160201.1 HAMP domain-containing histidine kinase [Nocardioides acrostichi]